MIISNLGAEVDLRDEEQDEGHVKWALHILPLCGPPDNGN